MTLTCYSVLKLWLVRRGISAFSMEMEVTRVVLVLLEHMKEKVKNALHAQQVKQHSLAFMFH